VSRNAAGTVRIRGGQLVIADGTLSADTGNTNGAPIAIDINVTGNLSLADTRGVPAMTARTIGTGDSGEIRLTSGNLVATSSFVDPFFLPTSLVDSHTSGDGRGGDVHIATSNLAVSGTTTPVFFFIDSGTAGNGHGGNVTINATTVDLDFASISTGQFTSSALLTVTSGVNGSAGNVAITADTLRLKDSILDTSASLGLSEFQKGGDITINASDISMKDTQVASLAIDGGGTFAIKANRFVTDFTSFETDTVSGQGGAISVEAPVVELTNGSSLISTTFGHGNAGDISLTAKNNVKILGDVGTNPSAASQPSGIFSNSFGFVGSQGNAGNVIVTTPKLEMVAGRINTVTASSGQGGNVTLNVTDSISISGEFPSDRLIIPSVFDIGPLAPSGIVTSTVGSEFCAGLCGNAGNVSVNTDSLSMGSGSQINSGTNSTGNGGLITINASDSISLSGRQSDGSPVGVLSSSIGTAPGSGQGGNINLTAGQSFTLINGASVSASSTGPGNAGNISINAGQQFDMRNSSVKTEAAQASGGNIDIRAVDRIRLVDSTISTSVLGGAGSGGNITIDPNLFVLQNSNVIAQAIQGAGGNITITTPQFLADQTSLVSATSQFGLNGTVTIQSPASNVSGSVGTLPSDTSQGQSLLTQRCAALANGQASSFVVAGREQLPADPGSWLTSPIALAGLDADPFRDGTVAKGTSNLEPRTFGILANDRVSLRRLTPSGFLIANFADSKATGCHS
jgi:large exoprotein involved in heme utilization and adhesion